MFKTWMEIHDQCPVCGLRLVRESGYFIGAFYIEYGFSAVVLTLLTLGVRTLHPFALLPALLMALLLYLPFIPTTIRLSRSLWIYFDQAIDPEKQ
jgi:hypothetical protein